MAKGRVPKLGPWKKAFRGSQPGFSP